MPWFTIGKFVVLLVLVVTCYIFYLKWQNAELKVDKLEQKYEQVLAVNEENAKEAEKAAARAEEDRKTTAKAIEKNKAIAGSGEQIKTENNNDPEGNTVAGPAWDRFADRLRNRQIGH